MQDSDSQLTLRGATTLDPIRHFNASCGASATFNYQYFAFSDDGRFLTTVTDGRGRLWHVDTGQLIGDPIDSAPGIVPAATPGTHVGLLTATEDTLMMWTFDPDSWPELAARAAGRNMTRAEWAQYGPRDEAYRPTFPVTRRTTRKGFGKRGSVIVRSVDTSTTSTRRSTHMRIRTVLAVALFAVTAVAVGEAAPVEAAGRRGTTQIEGVAKFDSGGACTRYDADDGALFVFTIEGSLAGCWYMFPASIEINPVSGVWLETGREEYVVCLNGDAETCGSLHAGYRFEGKYELDPDGVPIREIHGRCQHTFSGGTEVFAGATGRVGFKDEVETGCFFYKGHLDLAG